MKKGKAFLMGMYAVVLLLGILLIGCDDTLDKGQFTVTYDSNGATEGSPPVDSHKYSSYSTFVIKGYGGLAKDEFKCNGWATKKDALISYYKEGETSYVSNSDVVLYAFFAEYKEVLITDPSLVGTWKHTWQTDYYGGGAYGEEGIDYTLTITTGGSYTYIANKWKRYGGHYYNEGEVGTPSLDMSNIELHKKRH